MTESNDNPLHDMGVRAYRPENALRNALGKDIDLRRDLFTPERIAQSQQVINDAADNFFDEAMPDLDAMHRACLELEKEPAKQETVTQIAEGAFRMRGQSETLGFELIAKVSSSLQRYCEGGYPQDESGVTVVRKHVDTLRVAFAQSLKGDGGKTGKELAENLNKLIAKFAA